MTKPNSSLIAFVMDRSGSMRKFQQDTIGGFNTFLNDQKNYPSECVMYYTHFDHKYEIIHKYKPIQEVPELTPSTYVPRGNTALMDAIGRTIVQVGSDLADKPEDERPSTVIFVIQTDGLENASHEYKNQQIAEMIKAQQEQYAWQFIFMGASLEAFDQASELGVPMAASMQYSGQHTNSAFAASSRLVREVRTQGHTQGFSDSERKTSL